MGNVLKLFDKKGRNRDSHWRSITAFYVYGLVDRSEIPGFDGSEIFFILIVVTKNDQFF